MIECFGDSITVGSPGKSYIKYLKNKKEYLNYGKGGDTLLGVANRIEKYLLESSCDNFIIEIGANDILLPFLKNHSKKWIPVVDRKERLGSEITINKEDFIENYEKLLCLLKDKQIKIVTIPCLGENLESELNKKVDEYNQVIKMLCNKYNIKLIDFNLWQKQIIKSSGSFSNYFIQKNPFDVMLDSLLTTYINFTTLISKKRNLLLTVDGVHLNKDGAKGLACLIEK